MRRWSTVLLALGLIACGPGQPGGFTGDASDDQSAGSWDSGDPDSGDPDLNDDDDDGDSGDDDDADGDGDSGDADGDDADDDDGDDGDGDPDPGSVLFIGNSYTYTNDLPGMIASMAAADSIHVTIDSVTQGGAHVGTHLYNPKLAPLLAQGWDAVVINGQPFEPVLEYPRFEEGVVELVSMTGDARIVLYQTWPRRADSPDLVEKDLTVGEMWDGLEKGYSDAAAVIDSEIATVGAAWMSAPQLNPPIELYNDDANHPSYAGTYLSACVIYGKLFDVACSTSAYVPVGLPPENVTRLQIVADFINNQLDP